MEPDKDSFQEPASFRDPSGFVFHREGSIFRQINESYRECYDRMAAGGFYRALFQDRQLIEHEEVDVPPHDPSVAYKVIQPRRLPFISYPYEWCFSELKQAALLTLSVAQRALEAGFILKDSSAYNVQFEGHRPIFIDSLSFDIYKEGAPWVAYGQFCRHFLAPLALMSMADIRLAGLLRSHVDGIPLDLASRLLPKRSFLRFGLLLHIHLHARSQGRYSDTSRPTPKAKVSRLALLGILDSLRRAVSRLHWRPAGTQWADYYRHTNYSTEAFDRKIAIVKELLSRVAPRSLWDLGANVGTFSRLASRQGVPTVAFDMDPGAVETNYLQCAADRDESLLPLVIDFTSPSPGLGWQNAERMPLLGRGPAHAALALALVHHLAITSNLPFQHIAAFLGELCDWLIVEFVPKEDSQVKRLLAHREDIFTTYDSPHFEAAFSRRFSIERAAEIEGSRRKLYLMRKIPT
jgi:hypothetical protein